MSERITVDRKEFEAFLVDNQSLMDRCQQLVKRIDEVEKVNKQLQEDLQASKAKVESLEANLGAGSRQMDDSLRKTRETITRLIRETDKRVSK
jgi:predicted  nucleic acid-binding Zn-ribbon protein